MNPFQSVITNLTDLELRSQKLVEAASDLPPDDETLILSNEAIAIKPLISNLLHQAKLGLVEVRTAQGTLTDQDEFISILASAEAWVVSANEVIVSEPDTGHELLQQIQNHQVSNNVYCIG